MNHEEPDELWDLLGKARQPKVPPFFSAKVMQAVREEDRREEAAQTAGGGFWMAVRRWWRVSLATGAVAALAVFLALPSPVTPPVIEIANTGHVPPAASDPLAPLIVAVNDADELGSTLDNLLATQDHSIWLRADLSLP